MTSYGLLRLLCGIFSLAETHIIPRLRRFASWLRCDFPNWFKKLDFSRLLAAPRSAARWVKSWPVWSCPESFLYKFLSGLGSFFLDAFVIAAATAAMCCLLYFVW